VSLAESRRVSLADWTTLLTHPCCIRHWKCIFHPRCVFLECWGEEWSTARSETACPGSSRRSQPLRCYASAQTIDLLTYRYLTDVVFGNRHGMMTVRPEPLTTKNEPVSVRLVRSQQSARHSPNYPVWMCNQPVRVVLATEQNCRQGAMPRFVTWSRHFSANACYVPSMPHAGSKGRELLCGTMVSSWCASAKASVTPFSRAAFLFHQVDW